MTPQELREQFASMPMTQPTDDIPTVTVRASFDWKFWAFVGVTAWVLWESIGHMVQTDNRRGRRA